MTTHPLPGGHPTLRDRLLPWLYVLAGQTAFQLTVVFAGGLFLFLLPQAQEVLFAVSGAALDTGASVPWLDSVLPFVFLAGTSVGLALMVWYTSRLQVTLDADVCLPRALDPRNPHLRFAAAEVPRVLGVASAAFLVGAGIYAASQGSGPPALLMAGAVVAASLPAAGAYATLLGARARYWVGGVLAGVAVLHALSPRDAFVATISIFVPMLLTVLVIRRRDFLHWLRRRGYLSSVHPVAAPGEPVVFARAVWGLAVVTVLSSLALGLIGWLGVRWIVLVGSASVLLMFLSSLMGLGSVAYLVLRHWTRATRGALRAAWILFFLVCIALHPLGLSPLAERFGQESLPAVPHEPFKAPVDCRSASGALIKPSVLVNAYGGGIRAAVFTALLLARLDDQTQGRFGPCLHTLSGVSGGSLGINVYLSLREHYAAAGYWDRCPKSAPKGGLEGWVRAVLVRDHLSPVVGRMLTRDLWPSSPSTRGQVLLDSWNEALVSQIRQSRALDCDGTPKGMTAAGLAVPLGDITGGMAPAPRVVINATNVLDGQRIWFSNDDKWRQQPELEPLRAAAGSLARATVTVGEAVLQGARFPLVSPTGLFPPQGTQTLLLVDGGYADNSGASGLDFEKVARPVWININGNYLDNKPTLADAKDASSFFTPARALLSVRGAQAVNAIKRHEESVPIQPVTVNLNAVKPAPEPPGGADANARTRERRTAPLGWFVTHKTVQDMEEAMAQGAARISAALPH